jgi:HAD superfamily hydrolase (TIGR01490 family)
VSRPFAVFDIDGTLIRWQLYHALADELVKRGDIDAAAFGSIEVARMTWKTRSDEHSFDAYEHALVNLVNQALPSITSKSFLVACQAVLDEYKDQVYTYTRDLIKQLRDQRYLLFVISASQAEIVQMLSEYYGFDDYGGTVYEQVDGKFTGNYQPLRSAAKPEYLKRLVAKHEAIWQGSIGVGDSESDIPMLSTVDQPIAFNPSKKLFQHAQDKGWKVVVERKNMVYELEPNDGAYVLAQTNVG